MAVKDDPELAAVKRGLAVTGLAAGLGLLLSLLAWAGARTAPDRRIDRTAGYALLWPQGWAFFSTPPRGEIVLAYRRDGSRLEPVTRPLGDTRFGLDRSGYTTSLRAVMLSDIVPADRWRRCGPEESPTGCLADAGAAYQLDNPHGPAELCGPVVLTVERPRVRAPEGLPVTRQVLRLAVVDLRCRG